MYGGKQYLENATISCPSSKRTTEAEPSELPAKISCSDLAPSREVAVETSKECRHQQSLLPQEVSITDFLLFRGLVDNDLELPLAEKKFLQSFRAAVAGQHTSIEQDTHGQSINSN